MWCTVFKTDLDIDKDPRFRRGMSPVTCRTKALSGSCLDSAPSIPPEYLAEMPKFKLFLRQGGMDHARLLRPGGVVKRIVDGSDDEGRSQKQQYKKHSKLYIPK